MKVEEGAVLKRGLDCSLVAGCNVRPAREMKVFMEL